MTILVGILCEDGAVIAADGMASQNLGQTPFVGVNNLKVHCLHDTLVVACAGNDDLMTHFVHFLKSEYGALYSKHSEGSTALALMSEVGAQFAHYIMKVHQQYPQEFFTSVLEIIKSPAGFDFGALVALPFKDAHYMFRFDGRFNATMLRDNGIWHAILGSGYFVATPSIHLVKKILNISVKPKIDRGQLLAYWTVSHAIEVSSGGIGGEITLATLQKIDGQYKASPESSISEHKGFIDDMYKHIWNYERGTCEDGQIKEIPSLST